MQDTFWAPAGNFPRREKRRSRHMSSCRTEVTNKALDQYLFICQRVILLFKLSKHVFFPRSMAEGGGAAAARHSSP